MAVDDFYFTCLIPVTGDVTPENGPTEFLEVSECFHQYCHRYFILTRPRRRVLTATALTNSRVSKKPKFAVHWGQRFCSTEKSTIGARGTGARRTTGLSFTLCITKNGIMINSGRGLIRRNIKKTTQNQVYSPQRYKTTSKLHSPIPYPPTPRPTHPPLPQNTLNPRPRPRRYSPRLLPLPHRRPPPLPPPRDTS